MNTSGGMGETEQDTSTTPVVLGQRLRMKPTETGSEASDMAKLPIAARGNVLKEYESA